MKVRTAVETVIFLCVNVTTTYLNLDPERAIRSAILIQIGPNLTKLLKRENLQAKHEYAYQNKINSQNTVSHVPSVPGFLLIVA